ncbi:MAG: MarR family winged helix-turn-helix transcriptional regulator [Acidimicrobiales bacterium]
MTRRARVGDPPGQSAAGKDSAARGELVQRFLALRPIMQRRFYEELDCGLQEELESVTIHQLSVLEHLRGGAVSMRELARSLGISESAATAAADRLVRRGLLERLGDPTDRRIVRVALTATGVTVVDRVQQAVTRKTSRMLSALSDAQLLQLVDIFETLSTSGSQVPEIDNTLEGALQ